MLVCWREASEGQTFIVAAGAQRVAHRIGLPVLNRFGGGGPKFAANPGQPPDSARCLPEIRLLYQGLRHGKRCAQLLSPLPGSRCALPGALLPAPARICEN